MLDLLAIVVRRWRLVAGMILIGVVASAALTYEMTPSYRASAQLFVALDAADNAIELNSAASFSSQRVKSYPVAGRQPAGPRPGHRAARSRHQPPGSREEVRGEVSPNTVLIEVYADNTSPQLAADIANAVAVNFVHGRGRARPHPGRSGLPGAGQCDPASGGADRSADPHPGGQHRAGAVRRTHRRARAGRSPRGARHHHQARDRRARGDRTAHSRDDPDEP